MRAMEAARAATGIRIGPFPLPLSTTDRERVAHFTESARRRGFLVSEEREGTLTVVAYQTRTIPSPTSAQQGEER